MGQLVLAAMRLRRYKSLSIAQLKQAFLFPLLADRIAFAGDESDRADAPAGMAIWASVSEEVSARIAAQAETNAFPVVLAEEDWRSGDNVWLLDLLVPSREAGTALFAGFSAQLGGKGFRMHPVVAQSLAPETIERFREAIAGALGAAPAKLVEEAQS